MLEDANKKTLIGTIFGVMSFLYGCITEIVIVLAILMVFDYITGVTVALKERKFDPNVGVWGACRKLFYIMIVAVGFLADYVVQIVAEEASIGFSTGGVLGLAVVFYLIGNEGLSLARNWTRLGLPCPPILKKVFGQMQDAGKNKKPKEEC
jgi:toxin secretion/phage lysis holin